MSTLINSPRGLSRVIPAGIGATPRLQVAAGSTGVLVGDSITATSVFYAALQTTSNSTFTAAGVPVATWVNSGVSGAGLVDGIFSFAAGTNYITYVTQFNPSWLNIEVGVNDVLFGTPWDAATFSTRMTTFIQNCVANSTNLRIGQVNICSPWIHGDPTGGDDANLDQCLRAGRAVALALGCRYIDWRTGRPTDGGYTGDGIHPNDAKGKPYLVSKFQDAFSFVTR